jgi:hypothetical protein
MGRGRETRGERVRSISDGTHLKRETVDPTSSFSDSVVALSQINISRKLNPKTNP